MGRDDEDEDEDDDDSHDAFVLLLLGDMFSMVDACIMHIYAYMHITQSKYTITTPIKR